MGMIDYTKKKHAVKNIKKSSTEENIIETINGTIKSVSRYREKLVKGKVHNKNHYTYNDRQQRIADGIIESEKKAIADTIKSLKNLRETITAGNLVDQILQDEVTFKDDSPTI